MCVRLIARHEVKACLRCLLEQWFSNSSERQTPLEGTLKHRLLGATHPWRLWFMGLRKGPGSCISDTFPFEGQRPYLITAGLENFVTTIPVKANLINVGYSWTPKEPYRSFSDAAPSFSLTSPMFPISRAPAGSASMVTNWTLGERHSCFRSDVQGPGSRSDAHSFSVSGWSVFGLCLKHKYNSLILVSYPSQVLNYPIKKIHLVFDSWKIFLYSWKEVCGQSNSINFHWSDSEPSAQALLQGEGWGLATRRVAWGVQCGLHRSLGRGLGLWVGVFVTGVSDRLGKVCWHCFVYSRVFWDPRTHGVLCPGGDSLDPSAFFYLIGGLLGRLLWPGPLWCLCGPVQRTLPGPSKQLF